MKWGNRHNKQVRFEGGREGGERERKREKGEGGERDTTQRESKKKREGGGREIEREAATWNGCVERGGAVSSSCNLVSLS